MMKAFDDNYSGLDLKCDFPARESFRESLFAHLLSVSEQESHDSSRFDMRELDDSELEMLAAAQGEQPLPDDWPDTVARRH